MRESASVNDACAALEFASDWRCLADSHASASSIEATAGSFVLFAARAGRWTLVKSTGSVAQISGIRRSGGEDPYAACEPNQHYEDRPFTFTGAITFMNRITSIVDSG